MQMIRQSAIPSPNTRPLLDISAFVLKSSQCMPSTSSAAAVHAASGVSVDESLSLVRDAFGFLLLLSVVVCCCLLMYWYDMIDVLSMFLVSGWEIAWRIRYQISVAYCCYCWYRGYCCNRCCYFLHRVIPKQFMCYSKHWILLILLIGHYSHNRLTDRQYYSTTAVLYGSTKLY